MALIKNTILISTLLTLMTGTVVSTSSAPQTQATKEDISKKKNNEYSKRNMQRLITLMHTVVGCYDDMNGNCRNPQDKLNKIQKAVQEIQTIKLYEEYSMAKDEITKLKNLIIEISNTLTKKAEELVNSKDTNRENSTSKK